jgi:hypothetical protein
MAPIQARKSAKLVPDTNQLGHVSGQALNVNKSTRFSDHHFGGANDFIG